MTLGEFLTHCRTKCKHKTVRVFAGCMTIYKGNPSVIFMREWVKVQPYFHCKVLGQKIINDTIVVVI